MVPGHVPLLGDTLSPFCSLIPVKTISLSSYKLLASSFAFSCAISRVYSCAGWEGGAGRNSPRPSGLDCKSIYFILRKKETQFKQIIQKIFVFESVSACHKEGATFAYWFGPSFLLSSSFFFFFSILYSVHQPHPSLICGGKLLE